MDEPTPHLALGPLRIRWWRLWILGACWALGCGLVVAVNLFSARHQPRVFAPDAPDVIAVRVRDAATELSRGRPEVAIARLEGVRDEDPMNPYVHALLGQALGRDAARLPEAIAALRLAVTLDPLFTDAWYNLACLYGRQGDPNGAIRALAEAVALGFDDRQAVTDDADLAAIREDPRVSFFVRHGVMPASRRFAHLSYEPPAPVVGQPFDVVLSLYSLQEGGSEGEPFSVTFLGPSLSRLMRPVARSLKALGPVGEAGRGWELRYRLIPLTRYGGAFGPWEVRIDGQRVAMTQPPLTVAVPDGVTPTPAQETFRPRIFFAAPWPDVDPASAPRRIPGFEGGWSANDLAVELAPPPAASDAGGAPGWDGPGEPPPHYLEWIIPADEASPSGLRVVYRGGDVAGAAP